MGPTLGVAAIADGLSWEGVLAGAAGAILLLVGLPLLLICLFPVTFRRAWIWWFTRRLYRLEVHGREQLPGSGPALLVCNPAGYLDWLLLLAAQPRPIRFLLFTPWANEGWMGRFVCWTGAVAVDGRGGVRDVARALREARRALAAGDLVCLFVENYRSGDGFDLSFARVFRQVVRRMRAPIIPVALTQTRGSRCPLFEGQPVWRKTTSGRHPAEVAFGQPLPPSASAAEVWQARDRLGAEMAIARSPRRRLVHREFVRMAARHPFRSCFIDSNQPGRDLSYSRALAAVLILRRLFQPRLGAEAMVGVWLPPSAGGALVNITLAILGKTSVNLNYTASPEAVQSALRQCSARHVITSRRFVARLPLRISDDFEIIYLEDLLPLVTGWQRLSAWLTVLLTPGWVLEYWVLGLGRHRAEDLATVIFSSGSTGEPKGVMLSHGNIAADIESMIQAIALWRRDRLLGVLPLFHSFGYSVTLWTPLQIGASVVYHPDPRQAKEIGELCRKHRCTLYVSTATFIRFCLRRCQPEDFRSLRILICGAEKLPQPLAQEFAGRFGVLPVEGYGCTELSPVVSFNQPNVSHNGIELVRNRPGTIGPPMPGIAVRVVHPDTLEPLDTGEEGILLVCGANVMQGYLHRPDLTRKALRDGWYATGDMARLDGDGRITLTGRLSRFAKCAGEMVPLEKVEEVLHEIAGTTERICAVTCVPDEARGERIVVLYTAHNSLEVRSWCRELGCRGLPNLWQPAERDFFAVNELPVLGSGKLNLQRVQEIARELAGALRNRLTG
jgi:acyl-[acyl-carrier-protein]-phospholipid O-acyltransferase/long-chain-fatty-acid--[acyl-carrier-protein] ligase